MARPAQRPVRRERRGDCRFGGGIAFRVAGGNVGSLRLLDDLIPLVALALTYLTARTLLLDVVRAGEPFDPRLVASAGEIGLGASIALLTIDQPWNVIAPFRSRSPCSTCRRG